MSDKELDSQILQRAVEQFGAARHAFFRDLKFVVPLVLLFYGLVFVRYIHVSANQKEQGNVVAKLNSTRGALSAVEMRIADLLAAIRQGEEAFQGTLSKFPQDLRNEFLELDEMLKEFRKTPYPVPAVESGSSLFTQAQQRPLTESVSAGTMGPLNNRFFQGLEHSNLVELHDGASNDPKVTKLIEWIAETNIVHPAYARLNSTWATTVVEPFGRRRGELLKSTNEIVVLETATGGAGVMSSVEEGWRILTQKRFAPPDRALWWRTADEKVSQGRIMKGDVGEITAILTNTLKSAHGFLTASTERLTTFLNEAIAKQTELKSQMEGLQTQLDALQSQLKEFATAIPYIALPMRDAVLFFPSIVAIVAALFIGRYAQLKRQARTLAAAHAQEGATEKMLQMAFPEAAPSRGMVIFWTAVSLGAVGLVVASTRQLLGNAELAVAFPWSLYYLSIGAVCAAFGFLFLARAPRQNVK